MPTRTVLLKMLRWRSLPLPLAKASRMTSSRSAARMYCASMYHICLAKADKPANANNKGSPYLRGSEVCGRNNAPSLRYGDKRYRKTTGGPRGVTEALRTSNCGLWSSSSSSLLKSNGILLSSESWTRIRAEEESRPVSTGEEPRDEASELVELVERGLGDWMARRGGAFTQAIMPVTERVEAQTRTRSFMFTNNS